MNWGHKIFISFLLFGAGVATMLVISMREDVNLVSGDYYQQELDYQEQIERLNNYEALQQKPDFKHLVKDKKCILTFPSPAPADINGTVHFYRPSNSGLDKIYSIKAPSEAGYQFDVSELTKGMWTVKITWKSAGKEYYFEKPMAL